MKMHSTKTKKIRKCSAKQVPDSFLKKRFTRKVNNFYNVTFQQFSEAVAQLCSEKKSARKVSEKKPHLLKGLFLNSFMTDV